MVTGSSDNKGNSHVVAKLMTSKFLLCVILMEVAAEIQTRNFSLDLQWVPREQNAEADELSNSDPKRFDPENVIPVNMGNMKFIILDEMLHKGEKLHQGLEMEKAKATTQMVPDKPKQKRKPGTSLRATHPW